MSRGRYILCFILLLIIQLALTKYCQIGSYICISLLPVMVLCLPTANRTWVNMLIALGCGLIVDALADGQWGMNAAALVPAAALQKLFIRLFIGDEIVERHYSFSFWSNGVVKIGAAMLAELIIFTGIYVILDCAGCRSGAFIFFRTLASVMTSFVFGLIVVNTLCPRPSR